MSDTPRTDAPLSAATKPEKINARLFDLVRYMRQSLHAEELVSDEEYSWLCYGSSLAKGDESPSPRRLEAYDELRRRTALLERELTAAQAEITELRATIKENIATIKTLSEQVGAASELRAKCENIATKLPLGGGHDYTRPEDNA